MNTYFIIWIIYVMGCLITTFVAYFTMLYPINPNRKKEKDEARADALLFGVFWPFSIIVLIICAYDTKNNNTRQ